VAHIGEASSDAVCHSVADVRTGVTEILQRRRDAVCHLHASIADFQGSPLGGAAIAVGIMLARVDRGVGMLAGNRVLTEPIGSALLCRHVRSFCERHPEENLLPSLRDHFHFAAYPG